ncbi:hypothetical protein BD410DRAFT_791099 [Rickenella mellea]|uniref:GST N-terminal domain-containing protein n=1 Tax=Rickenella mellea TaxID=50990 RepID=A0A4Y7PYZ5_9AGAM|nr:hypothetical protein BD410DRAFT_791099 [Rickenella mellea]
MTITLYDISSTIPGAAWSPNVYKTRMALNYKGLEYKTEWVEYPDIGPLAKKIGALPTSIGATRELYTVPIIHDHATGKVASDSFAIAQYLDETYPDQPKLFPAGPGIAAIFDSYWMQHPIPALSKIVQPTIFRRLNTASHEFPGREYLDANWRSLLRRVRTERMVGAKFTRV